MWTRHAVRSCEQMIATSRKQHVQTFALYRLKKHNSALFYLQKFIDDVYILNL